MRAWHFLSVLNLLLTAVTLSAVIGFHYSAKPLQVTLPEQVRPRYEYARFSVYNGDPPTMRWEDRHRREASGSLVQFLQLLSKERKYEPSVPGVLNYAADEGWELVSLSDSYDFVHPESARMIVGTLRRPR